MSHYEKMKCASPLVVQGTVNKIQTNHNVPQRVPKFIIRGLCSPMTKEGNASMASIAIACRTGEPAAATHASAVRSSLSTYPIHPCATDESDGRTGAPPPRIHIFAAWRGVAWISIEEPVQCYQPSRLTSHRLHARLRWQRVLCAKRLGENESISIPAVEEAAAAGGR